MHWPRIRGLRVHVLVQTVPESGNTQVKYEVRKSISALRHVHLVEIDRPIRGSSQKFPALTY